MRRSVSRRRGDESDAGAIGLHPTRVEGGVVVTDERGRVRLGVSEDALGTLAQGGGAVWEMAVARLAARFSEDEDETGTVGSEILGGPPPPRVLDGRACLPAAGARGPSEGAGWGEKDAIGRRRPSPEVITASGFLGSDLLDAGLNARAAGRAVLLLVDDGGRRFVGPWFLSEGWPCVACLQAAVRPNRQTEGLRPVRAPSNRGARAFEDAALELLRRYRDELSVGVLEFAGDGRATAYHRLRSFPECPVCGVSSPVASNAARPRLRRQARCAVSDTGVRVSSPELALARVEHLVSPLTGAVRHVRDVDVGAPGLIHVCTASHAIGMRAARLEELLRDGRDRSGGKGATAAQARASAVYEAVERFSAVTRGDDVDRIGALHDVPGALHPNDCMLFSALQYEHRQEWNRRPGGGFHRVPEPFDPSAEVAWSRVWAPDSDQVRYVPTALLYFGFRGPGQPCCRADSNGLAAGQTMEEAILQGLLELIERDAVALWWYNRTRHAAVDVATFDDAYLEAVFAHYDRIGRDAWVLDLTSDVSVPVFGALSSRRGPGKPEIIFGFGAHPDASIALRRCVTEMNQMLATVLRPERERQRQLRGEYDDALAWWAQESLEGNRYVLPDDGASPRTATEFSRRASTHVLDDLEDTLNRVRRRGLDVFVRDMARADLGVPVVRVLAPGLRHFWRRLAPGRLYDVPTELGRLPGPQPETHLNPISFFA